MLNDVIAGRKQLTVRYAKKIEETFGIGADWLLYGDETAKEHPLSDATIHYLKEHSEVRKEIRKNGIRANAPIKPVVLRDSSVME